MQNALVKLIVAVFLIAMLPVACATSSATPPPEETPPPEPAVAPAMVETESAEEMQARRQYEIERNRFIYEDIFFAKNQYQLDAAARNLLDWKADWLLAHPEVQVVIEGHCGEGGRAENNMALGLRRAGEVKGYLLRKGVARHRLTAMSYGSERPIAEGQGEEVQAKNRRVRLMVVQD
jgi:outer membrane protein OmpA-like peptidoglycan-associated protein